VSLGSPAKVVLESDFTTARRWALDWRDWAEERGLTLRLQNRIVTGTRQALPTNVEIPDLDTAARLTGKGWVARLRLARSRGADLARLFPDADVADTVRRLDPLSETDFTLLCKAASWFANYDATGLTPRQVPIEGLHGKWLNKHQGLIQTLSGKEDLGLVGRPSRIHFTYLDPEHLAAGGRRHDSATIGDAATPAYLPTAVLISENKDTAVYCPALVKGIAVEGAGFAGAATLARVKWLGECRNVIYWGDIDAAGFEIVNRLRANGIQTRTILMDRPTYTEYERFGAWTDERGNPIKCSPRKALTCLTSAEQDLYLDLTDPGWTRVRRVEQERVPLEVAVTLLTELVSTKFEAAPRADAPGGGVNQQMGANQRRGQSPT
jgi:hypothetical protein